MPDTESTKTKDDWSKAPDLPPAAEAPKAQPEEEEVETLYFEGAFFVTSYQAEGPDGATLVFDRSGTDVPASQADQIVADAASHGVNLIRKAN